MSWDPTFTPCPLWQIFWYFSDWFVQVTFESCVICFYLNFSLNNVELSTIIIGKLCNNTLMWCELDLFKGRIVCWPKQISYCIILFVDVLNTALHWALWVDIDRFRLYVNLWVGQSFILVVESNHPAQSRIRRTSIARTTSNYGTNISLIA